MISSSVSSGQYSWGISYEYLLGWENLSGKIISIKHNHWSYMSFFSNRDFPYGMCCDFFRSTLFLEKLLLHTFSKWLLRHNSFIFGAAIFSEQLLFYSFFRTVSFSQRLFFQNSFFSERKFYRVVTYWEWEVLHGSYILERLFFRCLGKHI